MSERFKVSPAQDGLPPRREDACRVGVMRRIAAARLRYCGLESMADDVMLIVSELLTNALQHSSTTEISLSITVEDGALSVRVRDGMPGTCTAQHPKDTAEWGRGLLLVDALTKGSGGDWGTEDAGAETWCSLPVPEEGQP
ncbi:ATP-binding protein [Streptomyces pacificus]|uniref:ATP-binding protein n=2 Tax=Streptomyces pacificus TaxID=2705029 RepID=A0A6A0AQC0_9ACTN|nr:ATP-binding protein [Streptomyces pacificus]